MFYLPKAQLLIIRGNEKVPSATCSKDSSLLIFENITDFHIKEQEYIDINSLYKSC